MGGDRNESNGEPLAPAARASRFGHGVRALASRNYRLFFAGQLLSLMGTWTQQLAVGWLVLGLTHSAWWLGLVGFASTIPTFLVTPFAGILADRRNRLRILFVTQTIAMAQAAALAYLTLSGQVNVWHVLGLNVVLGLVNSVDVPTRQTFLTQVVGDRADLPNAIALNSSAFTAARLIGPVVAGLLIGTVGTGFCFAVNALSYLAVITALALMRVPPQPKRALERKVGVELREGFAYVARSVPIRSVLLLLALVSLMGQPFSVLMPLVATQVLHGDAHVLAGLVSSSAAGALLGALYMASRRNVLGLTRIIPWASACFGLGLIAFSFSGAFWSSVVCLLPVGFGLTVQTSAANTFVQTVVDEDKRGRVMALYATAFLGMAPFGSLIAGYLASRLGAPHTILFNGCAALVGAALFARNLPAVRAATRPIYAAKGIWPAALGNIER